jgi:DNA-binding transcriptional LysR family regulator
VDVLHRCASEHPEIALITEETSSTAVDFLSGDLILWFGEPSQGIPNYATSLGEDEIVIIAGSEVALRNLNAEQLGELYSEPSSVYQIWAYNEGNELRTIFDHAVLENSAISSYVLLAPDPAAMVEAVTADPMAIGYIPETWLTGDVQRISIEREIKNAFEQPILALTNAEPAGNLENSLVCLQQSSGP